MFLRGITRFRHVPSTRSFSTTPIFSFTVRRLIVDDETLIRKSEERSVLVKQRLAADIKRLGVKEVYRRSHEAFKKDQLRKQHDPLATELVPAKFSHPLLVVDVANFMKNSQTEKYFSHAFAARDLHADLRKAAAIDGLKAKTINVHTAPEQAPQLEIALVLEKVFRVGSYEGTVGNKDIWIRTVHAPDTRAINENAGDDAIALVVERARDEGRQVTLVSDDRILRERAFQMGAQFLDTKRFWRELEDVKSKLDGEASSENRLWTRLNAQIQHIVNFSKISDDRIAEAKISDRGYDIRITQNEQLTHE